MVCRCCPLPHGRGGGAGFGLAAGLVGEVDGVRLVPLDFSGVVQVVVGDHCARDERKPVGGDGTSNTRLVIGSSPSSSAWVGVVSMRTRRQVSGVRWLLRARQALASRSKVSTTE